MAPIFYPESADEHGLVAIGGDLSPGRLLLAYRSGVFPWFDDDMPICWWSPDPRAIFELEQFHIPRRLARTLRQGKFACTINEDFAGVIRGCADRPEEGTWITQSMILAYERLHELGWAHSVEVWRDSELVGGLYGVAIAGLFAGESMFSRCPDASKVALAFTVEHLRTQDFQLFDIQMINEHTAQFGAMEISRKEYLKRLRKALKRRVEFVERGSSSDAEAQ